MKRVLVTGASGFIGRHCLPILLARGYEVYAVGFRTSEVTLLGVHWRRADLLDANQIVDLLRDTQPTHLMHFAWCTTPGTYWTMPENLNWLQASLTLVQAFVQNGGQRLVTAGTCAEYDWHYGYCSEMVTPLMPTTLYGTCKNSLHHVLTAFAKEAGLSAAWGRIFFVYGPFEQQQRLVPSVINSLLRGEAARCSHGNQIRDFLHVEDVADAFVALLNGEMSGPVNIASGLPLALKDVIGEIAARFNRPDLVEWGAIAAAADEPPFLVADTRRLTAEVGWTPRHNLVSGLAQTIEWWRRRFEYATYESAA